jgi:hypothetical protein
MKFFHSFIYSVLLLQSLTIFCQNTDNSQQNIATVQALYEGKNYKEAIEMAKNNFAACLTVKYEEGCYQNARIIILSYMEQKEFDTAQKEIDNIIRQFPKEKQEIIGKCYFLKGRIFDEAENRALALKYYQRSIQQLTLAQIDTFSPPYNNSAYLYGHLDDNIKNIQYLNKAIHINLKRGAEGAKELPKNYNNLANAYIHGFKNYDKGIEYAEKAISGIRQDISGKSNIHLAWAWGEKGDKQKAISYCKNAIRTATEQHNTTILSYAYYTFGHIHEINHQYKIAYKYYKAYLEIAKKEKIKPNIVEAQAAIGRLLAKKGDYWGALQYFQEGLMTNCEQFTPKNIVENPFTTEQTNNITAALLLAKGETWAKLAQKTNQIQYFHDAIAAYEAGFYALQQAKSDFSEDLSKWNLTAQYLAAFESAIITAISLYERTCDSSFLEKAVYFSDQSRSISLRENILLQQSKELAGIPDSILQEEQKLKQNIIKLERQKIAATTTSDSIFAAKRKLDAYKTFIKTQYPQYYKLAYQCYVPFKIADVQSMLSKDQLVIHYFHGKSDLFTFTIHPTRGVQYYRQTYPTDFEGTLQKFLRTTSDWAFFIDNRQQSGKDFLETSPALYNFLLKKPVENAPDCKRLIIVPDGKLSYVPFQCLLTTPYEGKINDRAIITHYVLYKYDVSGAYGLDILLHQYNNPYKFINTNYSNFGGFASSYEDNFTLAYSEKKEETSTFPLRNKPFGGRLLHAVTEVNNAKNIWGGQVFINDEATKSNFLLHAKGCNIVQLALHAVIDELNPLNSSLIFTKKSLDDDNLLTLAEIHQMNMPHELTVLNACNTGNGTLQQGEGIISLDRAFARAGSRSLLTNLAPIEDKSIEFINKAFNQYLKMGMLKDKALTNAKLDYLQSAKVSSQNVAPIYWANSVITGNANPLSISKKISYTKNIALEYSILGFSTALMSFLLHQL